MARFDKLEFGQKSVQGKAEQPERPADRDEQYWLRMAHDQRSEGQYENALRFYSRTLELDKGVTVAWAGQVQMLILLREYPQADLWVRKAMDLFPSDGELLACRAQARCRMGDVALAQELSDGVISLPGESAYRWQVRAELVVACRKETDQMLFDRAQQASPNWLVPLESALIYLFYEMPAKAIARAHTAVERKSDAFYAWYVYGLALAGAGLQDRAVESLNRCLELAPRHALAQQKLRDLQRPGWSLRRMLRSWTGG
jgi:tetratricopeptide (TPR) repeat protein